MRGAGWCLLLVVATGVAGALGVSSRLPRTSAGQLAAAAAAQNKTIYELRNARNVTLQATVGPPPGKGASSRVREQYLFNVFEAIISTLESKLQRIENLDKAVEHLMRRVEGLDTRVNSNIDKTESVIAKLGNIDSKLFQVPNRLPFDSNRKSDSFAEAESISLNKRLVALDQKVSDIDDKLSVLKNQLDNNSLQGEDINVEASEKRSVSMNVIEITKALNTEVINHVTKELGQLRDATGSLDKKLQFHVNLVQENLGKVLNMMTDVHHAIVDDPNAYTSYNNFNRTTTTTTQKPELPKTNKIDSLVQQMRPIISVSEKMDEVWDVVVGTKSSVDDLVPKSDELLTQTQRQERAIGEIHNDLRTKTNKIIANLDKVEKRLKKQEDDVATLAQRPVPAEVLLDPAIDDLADYESTRYVDEFVTDTTLPVGYTTLPPQINTQVPIQNSTSQSGTTEKRPEKRKGGIIFPSVKNKPAPVNSTFVTSDVTPNIKDVKGYSCVDLLNAGMRNSGVYYLQIRGTTYWFLKVFCEQDIADGGWTVIQRRDDFGNPRENFNRDWNDYKNGFGDPAKEFWLGNENIYMLTNNEEYSLRVELEDFEGNKRYAQYSHFKIYSEAEYYKLEIDGYEGNAGDSLNDPWYGSNNSPFSTYNRDNDRSSLNCASMLKGGWWWKSCGRGLNGLYLNDPQDLTARQGIVWFRWRGWDYTLKKSVMMIKPKGFVSGT
ncbi:angiopoietin-2-like isoform X2 [Anoplophora glabripennis]|uniref:angiopoietin-2-like isoform X2 n=1 Tax=Anoplophora glabripennis TaxID=217634 RepID=UPI000875266D|nr:angiopoietin-2-like isoform X2 [Anoplophora glabripennis]